MAAPTRGLFVWLWAVMFSSSFQAGIVLADTGDAMRPSSWECLPDTAVVAVRIPNGQAVADALRQTTKLGNVLFSEERLQGLKSVLISQSWWEAVQQDLERHGLTPDDLFQIFAGETGFALALACDDPEQPVADDVLPLGLVWCEPGETLATRLWQAIEQAIEEQDDQELATQRLDIEVAGQAAMLLTAPHEEYDFDMEASDSGVWRSASPDDQAECGPTVRTEYYHLLMTQTEGRLLIGCTLVPTEDADDRQQIDRLTEVFELFAAAHQERPSGFASRLDLVPGLRDALPDQGVPIVEAFADLRRLIHLGLTADLDEDDPDGDLQRRQRILQASGADQIGVAAASMCLADSTLRAGLFVAIPGPRTGLMALLDQPLLEPRPPQWVPASVVEYRHISLDLGRIYTTIKDFIVQEVDPDVESRIAFAEMSVKGFANADLATVLSSVGTPVTSIDFEPRWKDAEDTEDGELPELEERSAAVWTIENQEIWNRLLETSRSFSDTLGQFAEYVEEQGFAGYRAKSELVDVAAFLGKGYLVIASGEGVASQTLSVLNHPPEGEDALVDSPVYAQAAELLPLEPGLTFSLVDGNRYTPILHQLLERMLELSFWETIESEYEYGDDGESEDEDTIEDADLKSVLLELRKLMPTAEEFQNVLGVNVGYVRATGHGLEVKEVGQLPAP